MVGTRADPEQHFREPSKKEEVVLESTTEARIGPPSGQEAKPLISGGGLRNFAPLGALKF